MLCHIASHQDTAAGLRLRGSPQPAAPREALGNFSLRDFFGMGVVRSLFVQAPPASPATFCEVTPIGALPSASPSVPASPMLRG